MVGRQHDREEVLRLLNAHGVVTLTGPGGVGKTRLALDIAADWETSDVVVVPLAAVGRADRVEQAVASHLGLRLVGETGPEEVAAALADRELLLVLDNCEHVVEACRWLVVAVRRAAAGVRVLATSRVTLQVPGEYVVRLHPLPVPRDAMDLDALRRQPGVRAFVEHARRRAAGFELEPGDAADLVEVLRRLDGLPLGIELAARQVAVMPLRAVRERLDRALDLATGRLGPEDARQRTLRASIASSYELLGEPEQRLLRALASFPGGVDLATVEAAADGDGDPSTCCTTWSTPRCSWRTPRAGGTACSSSSAPSSPTWWLTLGEEDAARRRFLARCVVVAEEIREGVYTADEPSFDRRLRAELDNLRAARDLARDHGDLETLVAITLAAIEVGTWRDIREIWTWVMELADDPVLEGRPDRVLTLSFAAEAARVVGDFAAVARLSDAAFALADATTDRSHLARAWSARATVAHYDGDFDAAVEQWLKAADTAPARGGGRVHVLGGSRRDVRRPLRRGPRAARQGSGGRWATSGRPRSTPTARTSRGSGARRGVRTRRPSTARPSSWPHRRGPGSSRAWRGSRSPRPSGVRAISPAPPRGTATCCTRGGGPVTTRSSGRRRATPPSSSLPPDVARSRPCC